MKLFAILQGVWGFDSAFDSALDWRFTKLCDGKFIFNARILLQINCYIFIYFVCSLKGKGLLAE